jgi:hypothetical protein
MERQQGQQHCRFIFLEVSLRQVYSDDCVELAQQRQILLTGANAVPVSLMRGPPKNEKTP